MYVARTELKSLKLKVKYRNTYNKEITQCIENEVQIPKATILKDIYCFPDSESDNNATVGDELKSKSKIRTSIGYRRYVFALRKDRIEKDRKDKQVFVSNNISKTDYQNGNGNISEEKGAHPKSPVQRKRKIKKSVVSKPAKFRRFDKTGISQTDSPHPDNMLSMPPTPRPNRGGFSFARIRATRIPCIDKMAALESQGFICNAVLNTKGAVAKLNIMNRDTCVVHSTEVAANGDVPPCSNEFLDEDISVELESQIDDIPYEGVSNEDSELLFEQDNSGIVCTMNNYIQSQPQSNVDSASMISENSDNINSASDLVKSDICGKMTQTSSHESQPTRKPNGTNGDFALANSHLSCKDKATRGEKSVIQNNISNSIETDNHNHSPDEQENNADMKTTNSDTQSAITNSSFKPQCQKTKANKTTHKSIHRDINGSKCGSEVAKGSKCSSKSTGHDVKQNIMRENSDDETDIVKLCITHAMPIKVREKKNTKMLDKMYDKDKHVNTPATKDVNGEQLSIPSQQTKGNQSSDKINGKIPKQSPRPTIPAKPTIPITRKPGERNIFDALYEPTLATSNTDPVKASDLLSGLAVSDMDDFLCFDSTSTKEDTKLEAIRCTEGKQKDKVGEVKLNQALQYQIKGKDPSTNTIYCLKSAETIPNCSSKHNKNKKESNDENATNTVLDTTPNLSTTTQSDIIKSEDDQHEFDKETASSVAAQNEQTPQNVENVSLVETEHTSSDINTKANNEVDQSETSLSNEIINPLDKQCVSRDDQNNEIGKYKDVNPKNEVDEGCKTENGPILKDNEDAKKLEFQVNNDIPVEKDKDIDQSVIESSDSVKETNAQSNPEQNTTNKEDTVSEECEDANQLIASQEKVESDKASKSDSQTTTSELIESNLDSKEYIKTDAKPDISDVKPTEIIDDKVSIETNFNQNYIKEQKSDDTKEENTNDNHVESTIPVAENKRQLKRTRSRPMTPTVKHKRITEKKDNQVPDEVLAVKPDADDKKALMLEENTKECDSKIESTSGKEDVSSKKEEHKPTSPIESQEVTTTAQLSEEHKQTSTKTVKEQLAKKIHRKQSEKEASVSASGAKSNASLPTTAPIVTDSANPPPNNGTLNCEDTDVSMYQHKKKMAMKRHRLAKLEAVKSNDTKQEIKYQMLNGRGLVDPALNITLLVNPHNNTDRKRISITDELSNIYNPPLQKEIDALQPPKAKRRRLSNKRKSTSTRRISSTDKEIIRQLSSPPANQGLTTPPAANDSFMALVHVASEIRDQQKKQEASPIVSPTISKPIISPTAVSPKMTTVPLVRQQMVKSSVPVTMMTSVNPVQQMSAAVNPLDVIQKHSITSIAPGSTMPIHSSIPSSDAIKVNGKDAIMDIAKMQNLLPFLPPLDILMKQGLDPQLQHILLYGRSSELSSAGPDKMPPVGQLKPPIPPNVAALNRMPGMPFLPTLPQMMLNPGLMNMLPASTQSIRTPMPESAAIRNMLIRSPAPRMASQVTPSSIVQHNPIHRPPPQVPPQLNPQLIAPGQSMPPPRFPQLPLSTAQQLLPAIPPPTRPPLVKPPSQGVNSKPAAGVPNMPTRPLVKPRRKIPKTIIDQYKKDANDSRAGKLNDRSTQSKPDRAHTSVTASQSSNSTRVDYPITTGLLSDVHPSSSSMFSNKNSVNVSASNSQSMKQVPSLSQSVQPFPHTNQSSLNETKAVDNRYNISNPNAQQSPESLDLKSTQTDIANDTSNIPLVVLNTSPAHSYGNSDDDQPPPVNIIPICETDIAQTPSSIPDEVPQNRDKEPNTTENEQHSSTTLDETVYNDKMEAITDNGPSELLKATEDGPELATAAEQTAESKVDDEKPQSQSSKTEHITPTVVVVTPTTMVAEDKESKDDTVTPNLFKSESIQVATAESTQDMDTNDPIEPVVSTQSDTEPMKIDDVRKSVDKDVKEKRSKRKRSSHFTARKRKQKKVEPQPQILPSKVEHISQSEFDDSARLDNNQSPDTTVVTPPAVLGVIVKLEAPDPNLESIEPQIPEPSSFTRSLSVSSFDLDAECGEDSDNDSSDKEVTLQSVSSDDLWQELLSRKSLHECVCGASFTSSVLYMLHKACHNTDEPHWCATCGHKSNTWMEFFVHLYDHNK